MLTALQRRLIYHPDPSPVPPADQVIDRAQDVTLRTSDGLMLRAWFVPAEPASDRRLAVLLVPGNGGNRWGRAGFAVELGRRGLAVLLMDYRGYGGNPGRPSEEGLARDSMAGALLLDDLGYPAQRTIYFGESLGTGVVAGLQARRPPAGLVLRSPFPRLADVGAHHYPWLPVRAILHDRFETAARLADSEVPVTVIYGDRDTIVPPGLSAQVADQAKSLLEQVVLRGADHDDEAMFGPQVADPVERLANRVG